jgi:hypothetical protein
VSDKKLPPPTKPGEIGDKLPPPKVEKEPGIEKKPNDAAAEGVAPIKNEEPKTQKSNSE